MKNNKLSKEWWLGFLKRNKNFTNTCTIHDAFVEQDVDHLTMGVQEVLYERINSGVFSNGFRLYSEGSQLKTKETTKLFTDNKPNEDEDIISYCERLFDEKFGIIMNYNETYSDKLAVRVNEMITPLFELIGTPPLGFEITVFVGNYGWTPLGIHTDGVGENVIHFHLGPGNKTMYTWDKETYEKLAGKNVYNNKNVEPLLEHANKWEFGPGDVYYMPWFENHIGYSRDLSIGVTLWFRNCSNQKYASELLRIFRNQFMSKDKRIIPCQIDYLNNNSTFDIFESMVSKYIPKKDPTLKDFLHEIYSDFKYCIASNGGWRYPPAIKGKDKRTEEDETERYENSIISIVKPFKILHRVIDDKNLLIYIRGSKLKLKYFLDLIELIELLNTGQEVNVQDFILKSDLSNDVICYFIGILEKNMGIKVVHKELVFA